MVTETSGGGSVRVPPAAPARGPRRWDGAQPGSRRSPASGPHAVRWPAPCAGSPRGPWERASVHVPSGAELAAQSGSTSLPHFVSCLK